MRIPDDLNRNLILERFKKGEISIDQAFKLLIGQEEKKENIRLYPPDHFNEIDKAESKKEENSLDDLLDEMDKLIGLQRIKDLIREFIAYLKVQSLRRSYSLKSEQVVMHMIFKGNPGTGKTTMARLIGKIFKELGYLKNGSLLEGERADLVGEYIGHTAQKTKKLIHKALGGVLFIDEAYSLARGGEKDFGKEAIDTMVKAMEDNKDNLIIILAGYRDEMDYFLETNPGLRSRFAIQLDFDDYSIDELVRIAELMFNEREYLLDKDSKHYIYRVITYLRNREGTKNGNARTVRNLVEKAIRHQARRIIQLDQLDRLTLMTIKKEDLSGGVVIND